jgi:hypothetical protein
MLLLLLRVRRWIHVCSSHVWEIQSGSRILMRTWSIFVHTNLTTETGLSLTIIFDHHSVAATTIRLV